MRHWQIPLMPIRTGINYYGSNRSRGFLCRQSSQSNVGLKILAFKLLLYSYPFFKIVYGLANRCAIYLAKIQNTNNNMSEPEPPGSTGDTSSDDDTLMQEWDNSTVSD